MASIAVLVSSCGRHVGRPRSGIAAGEIPQPTDMPCLHRRDSHRRQDPSLGQVGHLPVEWRQRQLFQLNGGSEEPLRLPCRVAEVERRPPGPGPTQRPFERGDMRAILLADQLAELSKLAAQRPAPLGLRVEVGLKVLHLDEPFEYPPVLGRGRLRDRWHR